MDKSDINLATQKFWDIISTRTQNNLEFFNFLYQLPIHVGNYQSLMEWFERALYEESKTFPEEEPDDKRQKHNHQMMEHFKNSSDFNNANLYLFFYEHASGYINEHPLMISDLDGIKSLINYCLATGNIVDHIELLLLFMDKKEIQFKTGFNPETINKLYKNNKPCISHIKNQIPLNVALRLENVCLHHSKIFDKLGYSSEYGWNREAFIPIYQNLSIGKNIPQDCLDCLKHFG